MDGRTDRQTEFSSINRVCILCSAVQNAVVCDGTAVQYNKIWRRGV